MPTPPAYFTPFISDVSAIALPTKFTFPFCYEAHPLASLAAEQLQQHLLSQQDWQHDFGLDQNNDPSINEGKGKMFGVLVVENSNGELGYLSAFSGKIADQNLLPGFVPPVYDMLAQDGFVKDDMAEITEISNQYKAHAQNPEIDRLREHIKQLEQQFAEQLAELRSQIIEARATRKIKRKAGEQSRAEDALTEAEFQALLNELSRQSVFEKKQTLSLKAHWQKQIGLVQSQLDKLESEVKYLLKKRRKRSAQLQKKVFAQYQFLNKDGQLQDLNDIFAKTPDKIPPAGAGECAAPKLLQYAFEHNLRPVTMAEFWWGVSPKSAIRQHKKFYASCTSKCLPILTHMLSGIEMDDNPLLINTGRDKHIEIIFADEHMLVINKPEDLLSVPGKNVEDSVYTRIKALYPQAKGPIIVHRLDMSTSGLMVLALTKEANKRLQRQFISRSVQKRYVAVIEGRVAEDSGVVELPLRQDLEDRPRQLVCYEHGKPAYTTWQVIARNETHSKLYLYPKTGRTHQLRMHCAHALGLNMPIVGDDLYGQKANRLHLHAQRLELTHPFSREPLVFEVDDNF